MVSYYSDFDEFVIIKVEVSNYYICLTSFKCVENVDIRIFKASNVISWVPTETTINNSFVLISISTTTFSHPLTLILICANC